MTAVAALDRRTTEEWEVELGLAVRRVRKQAGLTQQQLARAANVSLSSVQNLERGGGSSLRTLVRVARALGRESWLGGFAPPEPTISPLAVLKASRARES